MTANTAMSRENSGEAATDRENSGEAATDRENSESDDDHLAGVEDGAGCTEIWEHLSRGRRATEEARNARTDDD